MSAGEDFSKADNTAGDEATGEPALDRVWSKLATIAFVEETVLTTRTSEGHIGGSLDFCIE
jgi:hypothetical protein